MRYVYVPVLVAVLSLSACASKTSGTTTTTNATAAHSGGKLYVQSPALYDKKAVFKTDASVRAECMIDKKLSDSVQEQAKRRFEVVPSKTLVGAGNHKALSLTITEVEGLNGGPYTGFKTIALRGTLTQAGKVIGSFSAMRRSGGGAFIGYKGTCAIFERDTDSLGEDIAEWLAKPSMNAKLGDLP